MGSPFKNPSRLPTAEEYDQHALSEDIAAFEKGIALAPEDPRAIPEDNPGVLESITMMELERGDLNEWLDRFRKAVGKPPSRDWVRVAKHEGALRLSVRELIDWLGEARICYPYRMAVRLPTREFLYDRNLRRLRHNVRLFNGAASELGERCRFIGPNTWHKDHGRWDDESYYYENV